MTHLLGQRLGRYEIEEEIGRGGMARVYRATDTSLRRTVALKVLAPQLAVDPEFAHRFEREAVTAANLRHPNIVGIYDVGEQDGVSYIAMEYVRGRSLHAIIEERGALGLGLAVGVVEAVASALDYAHTQGAVHRDVKPQNIMIDTDGRVLLTDFGIAQPPEDDTRRERLTRTGVFMGTPEYISPEQASAERVNGRSDLYSLGIVTYEMITGAVPFSGSTLQIIVAHVQHEPPPPSSFAPELPREIDRVLARILAKQPADRFGSGAAFTSALRIVARKNLIPIATAVQLAELTTPRTSSGQETVLLGQTPSSMPAAPLAVSARPPSTNEPTQVGESPLIEAPLAPRRRPLPARPRIVEEEPPRALPLPAGAGGRFGRRIPWKAVAGLFGGAALLLLFVLFGDTNAGNNPFMGTATATRTLIPDTPLAATLTNTPTPPPTAVPEPTERPSTPVPSPTPITVQRTNTPAPPTRVPPTATPEPATDTPVPPTDTLVPPTLLPTSTFTPTLTPTLTPTPTLTLTPTEPPVPTKATETPAYPPPQQATLPSQPPALSTDVALTTTPPEQTFTPLPTATSTATATEATEATPLPTSETAAPVSLVARLWYQFLLTC